MADIDRQNYGSILRKGVTPQTRTAISQKSKVFSFTTGDDKDIDRKSVV
jgi:hypothetical protein